ncbi:alpha/beta hydrolase [Nocardia fluminea]|uniref:alpha/beta hydrolase n=1 Tax=Nocardia fluminea TaxID=134984 RepID=UPI0033EF9B1D
MPLQLDPDLAAALVAGAAASAAIPTPARGDALTLRGITDQTLTALLAQAPAAAEVDVANFSAIADDGTNVRLRWYTRNRDAPGSAIVYIHGGGMICGSLDIYEPLVRHYVQRTGVPFLAVDYRLAPEFPGTTPAEDSFAALKWLLGNASELAVNPERVALMGDSAGGGIGAGVAILARDHGLHLARQILVYPMLDDRNIEPDSALDATATWTYDNNYTGWHALLGDEIGTPTVSPVAAPARLANFTDLPPTYIEVGELDIFRDEAIDYARSLLRDGVSCELHVLAGAPHAHDLLGMTLQIGQQSLDERVRVIASI